MPTILSDFEQALFDIKGFEQKLVYYVRHHGEITSLDRFAHDTNYGPANARRCAHAAAAKGLIKLTRLEDKSGRPYRVSALEEET